MKAKNLNKDMTRPFLKGHVLKEDLCFYFNKRGDYITTYEIRFYDVNTSIIEKLIKSIFDIIPDNLFVEKNDVFKVNSTTKTYITFFYKPKKGFFKYSSSLLKKFKIYLNEIEKLFLKYNTPFINVEYDKLQFLRVCYVSSEFSNKSKNNNLEVHSTHLKIDKKITKCIRINSLNTNKYLTKGIQTDLISDFIKSKEYSELESSFFCQSFEKINSKKIKSQLASKKRKYEDSNHLGFSKENDLLVNQYKELDSELYNLNCLYTIVITGSKEKINNCFNYLVKIYESNGLLLSANSFEQDFIFFNSIIGTSILIEESYKLLLAPQTAIGLTHKN